MRPLVASMIAPTGSCVGPVSSMNFLLGGTRKKILPLRTLTTAVREVPFYPWIFQAPNGKVFLAGDKAETRYLDTSGTGALLTSGARPSIGALGGAMGASATL